MAIKKKWSTMKRLSEKEKEQPINLEKLRYRDPRPTICLDSDNLPEIKNWEVGKEYNANVILKVDGKADNIDEETGKRIIRATLKLAGIMVDNLPLKEDIESEKEEEMEMED